MLDTVQNKGFYNFTEEKGFWKVGGGKKKEHVGTIVLELSNLSLCDLLVYFESSPHFATVIPSRTNQSHPKAKEGIEDMCILHDHNSHTPKRAILHTLLSLCHLYMID